MKKTLAGFVFIFAFGGGLSTRGQVASSTPLNPIKQSSSPELPQQEAARYQAEQRYYEQRVKQLQPFELPAKIVSTAAGWTVNELADKTGLQGKLIGYWYGGMTKTIMDPRFEEKQKLLQDKNQRDFQAYKSQQSQSWGDLQRGQQEINQKIGQIGAAINQGIQNIGQQQPTSLKKSDAKTGAAQWGANQTTWQAPQCTPAGVLPSKGQASTTWGTGASTVNSSSAGQATSSTRANSAQTAWQAPQSTSGTASPNKGPASSTWGAGASSWNNSSPSAGPSASSTRFGPPPQRPGKFLNPHRVRNHPAKGRCPRHGV